MRFNRVYIEKGVASLERVTRLREKLKETEQIEIDNYEDYFSRVHKPYLHKRNNLNLFIAAKKGLLVKEAPPAYGLSGEPHYYFTHSYNCIFECEYCYLQGYFNSPDIVLFVNYEEMLAEIKRIAAEHYPAKVWFHAGEFSDSLALSHLTGEWEYFFEEFSNLSNTYLELRTKSASLRALKQARPAENIFISYSLSPGNIAGRLDRSTSTVQARIRAARALNERGFRTGFHFDPVIYTPTVLEDYRQLTAQLTEAVRPESIAYISIGVVRFTTDVYRQVRKNYPESALLDGEFIRTSDNLVRYIRPLRMRLLNDLRAILLKKGVKNEKIYLCMEDDYISAGS